MKIKSMLVLGLGLAGLGGFAVRADNPSVSDTPYAAIAARNAFNLVPLPANPAETAATAESAAKITPNGIMALFGAPQVLFKVTTPVGPGQPPQVRSYVMSEGDQADGITVTRIDSSAHVITFDNHGTVQTIALADAETAGGDSPSQPVGLAGGQPTPERPAADAAPSPDAQAAAGPAAANADGTLASINPDAASGPEVTSAGQRSSLNEGSDANRLTPEAQVVLMEARRQQLQQEGDPAASVIPPTEISQSEQILAGGPVPAAPNP